MADGSHQRQLVPVPPQQQPQPNNGSTLLLGKLFGLAREHLDSSFAFDPYRKRDVYEKLKMIFFMRKFFNVKYLIPETPANHLTAIRHESQVCEEGFLLNLQSLVQRVKNREYTYAQSFIRDIWNLVDTFMRRSSYDSLSDHIRILLDDIAEAMHFVDSDEGIKRDLKICCAASRVTPFRNTACRAKDCVLMVEINSPCYILTAPAAKHYNISDRERAKLVVCKKCFDDEQGETIEVKRKKPGTIRTEWNFLALKKELFFGTAWTADMSESEPLVDCLYCNNQFHQICEMYDQYSWTHYISQICPAFGKAFKGKFVCNNCFRALVENELKRYKSETPETERLLRYLPYSMPKIQPFSHKSFRRTKLSNFMEAQVRPQLFEWCMKENVIAQDIQIRELCSRTKVFEAKPRMRKEFEKKGMPTRKEYMYKSIMVYQKCANPDSDNYIAVFNLIVHEYPEDGFINLSYIDSVKLFEPSCLRPQLYRLIIQTYLQYIQQLGTYRSLHIWVCPPKGGDEYVFYGRPFPPPGYKPKSNYVGLINWYKMLLQDSVNAQILTDFFLSGTNKSNPYPDVTDVPYMADDFWPDRMETLLEEHERENELWEASQASPSPPRPIPRGKGKGKGKTGSSSRTHSVKPPLPLKAKFDKVVKLESSNLLFTATFAPASENFQKIPEKEEEKEEDIYCFYMGSRDNYLMDCRENAFDFADPRRAGYSTLFLSSRLAQESMSLKCLICSKLVRKGYYCVECDEAVFCSSDCAQNHTNHNHDRSTSPFRGFVVPLDDTPVDDKDLGDVMMKAVIFTVTRRIMEETQAIFRCKTLFAEFQRRPCAGRLGSFSAECVTYFWFWLYHADRVDQSVFKRLLLNHMKGCPPCTYLFVGLNRHWKVCGRTVTCRLCNRFRNRILAIQQAPPQLPQLQQPQDLNRPRPRDPPQRPVSVAVRNTTNGSTGIRRAPPSSSSSAGASTSAHLQPRIIMKRKENHENPHQNPKRSFVCVNPQVGDVQPTSTIIHCPESESDPRTRRFLQIQNNEVRSNNDTDALTLNLIDMCVQKFGKNGFLPLANHTGGQQSAASQLNSQFPFTDTLNVRRVYRDRDQQQQQEGKQE